MSASPDLPSPARTLLLTLVAVVAFAANSVLCRLALGEGLIDAASFATVRVMAGALILVVLLKEGFGLLEFYTQEVSRLKGVQSVETFVVYKSYNLKIPYIF